MRSKNNNKTIDLKSVSGLGKKKKQMRKIKPL